MVKYSLIDYYYFERLEGSDLLKRLFVLLCAFLILLTALSPAAAAAEATASKREETPLILISGFMCSKLFTDFGTDVQTQVWGLNAGEIAAQIRKDAGNFVPALFGLLGGNAERFGAVVGDGATRVMEKLKCTPQGVSVYPVTHYPNTPATSSLAYMQTHDDGAYLYEKNFCEYISEKTDPNRVFCYQYDSRLDAVTLAEELKDFIDAVRAATGSRQVRLFALSYGGLIVSTYLTYHGAENAVERVVMSVPALGGTDIPARILRGDIALAKESLIMFVGTALGGESNYARLLESDRAGWIDRFAQALSGGLREIARNWGSVWSLSANSDYAALKAEFLDPAESGALIARLDRIHNEVMPHLRETFAACRARGTQISILCGTGSPLVTGGPLNGDMILPASGVSGAKTAPLGKRFADGYVPDGAGCSDPAHCHVSPSMEIDASCAYLPENTWFINGHYHGQYFYEDYTRSLVTKLLLTDELRDVHSDPAYPQFETSSHPYRTLHVAFDESPSGYVSDADRALEIRSLTEDCYIRILSVVAQDLPLTFDVSGSGLLAPGETVRLPFSGALPQVAGKCAQLTVNYLKLGSPHPLCTCTVNVTVQNGAPLPAAGGLVPLEQDSGFRRAVPEFLYRAVERCALRQSVECIYDTVRSFFD